MTYHSRRIVLEYDRQDRVREGWFALREVARCMRRNLRGYTRDKEEFLKRYESQLKGLLAVRATRDHRALAMYQNQAAFLRNGGHLEFAVDHLERCGPF